MFLWQRHAAYRWGCSTAFAFLLGGDLFARHDFITIVQHTATGAAHKSQPQGCGCALHNQQDWRSRHLNYMVILYIAGSGCPAGPELRRWSMMWRGWCGGRKRNVGEFSVRRERIQTPMHHHRVVRKGFSLYKRWTLLPAYKSWNDYL